MPFQPAEESPEVFGYRILPLQRSMLTLLAGWMVASQTVRATEPT